MSTQPTIDELLVAAGPDAWRAAGFDVQDDLCVVGTVRLRLEGAERGRGIVGWTVRGAGFELRREREGPTPGGSQRQSFFRMGEVILEVIQAPPGTRIADDPEGPARLWGISFLVEGLEQAAASLGDLLGEPRAAVQPGRRIATVRKEAGLGPAIAFMTPGPGAIPV